MIKYDQLDESVAGYCNRKLIGSAAIRQMILEALAEADPSQALDEAGPAHEPLTITRNQPFSFVAEVAVHDVITGNPANNGEELVQRDPTLKKAKFTSTDKEALFVAYNAMREALSGMQLRDEVGETLPLVGILGKILQRQLAPPLKLIW